MSGTLPGTLETILVVDDNEFVLQTVVTILKRANFNVLFASSGAIALKLAEETAGTIHLLLSDVDMPGMSGPGLGETLKKSRPDMHVMLMSGGTNGNLLVLNYGWAFIQKPFVQEKLVRMITSVLQRSFATRRTGVRHPQRYCGKARVVPDPDSYAAMMTLSALVLAARPNVS
jgi:DNA-binding NtrC family response regulator